jgi:hypothetical protein
VIFTVDGFGTVAGAVYKPAAVTVPQVEPEHPVPLRVQVTAPLLVPLTFA